MKNKFYILIAFCLLATLPGYTQKNFSITLLDNETNQPVGNAVIEISMGNNKSPVSKVTDAKGKVVFDISNVQISDKISYDFKITAKNYYGPVKGLIYLKHPLDRIHMIKKIPEIQNTVKEKNNEVVIESKQTDPISSTNTSNQTIPKIESPDKAIFQNSADNNFVFLIDVSASMNNPKRMPILKEALKYIVSLYRPTDYITLITYAYKAEIILKPTSAKLIDSIYLVIDSLKTGGKTMGGVGLELAYETALENYIDKGNNKVIIATDGAFTNDKKEDKIMLQLVNKGLLNNIKLTSLAFGQIDKKDEKRLKVMTQKGAGGYYHIETLEEGKNYLIKEATSEKRE